MNNRSLYKGLYAYEAPAYLKRAMRARAGNNPYGEPLYRLVKAEARFRMSGGTWTIWSRNTPIADRNELYERPLGHLIEIRPVPMYPGEFGKWILERWFDASLYGSAEIWDRPMACGGTKKWTDNGYLHSFGEFPSQGDYEGTGWAFPDEALSESIVLSAIGRIERAHDGMPGDPRTRMQKELAAAELEEQEKERKYHEWAMEVVNDASGHRPFTPGGQAEICRIAEKAGIRSHPF